MAKCRAHPMNPATEMQVQDVFLPAKAGRPARTVRMKNWVCKIDVRKASADSLSFNDQQLLAQMRALQERIGELEAKAKGGKKAKRKELAEGDIVSEDPTPEVEQ